MGNHAEAMMQDQIEGAQRVPAETLGGLECEHCGNAVTGEAGRICGDCLTAYREAMRQDEQRAEWHAEMRRDAFGA